MRFHVVRASTMAVILGAAFALSGCYVESGGAYVAAAPAPVYVAPPPVYYAPAPAIVIGPRYYGHRWR